MPLSDVKIRNAKPREKSYKLFDGLGLYLEVMPGGSKLWRLKYRIHGKDRRLALGAYGDVSLAEAREGRDQARRLLRAGKDPVAERRSDRAAAEAASRDTVRLLAAQWIETQAPTWTADYAKDVERSLELHVFPALGDRSIASVTPQDVLAILRPLGLKGARWETVRRVRQRLEGMFALAVVEGRLTSNPAQGIQRGLTPPVVRHLPAVTETELPDVLAAVTATGNRLVEAACWLLTLTAVRTGELRFAEWSEIDEANRLWRIPAARMKRRREHVVPFSRQAWTIIERLRELTGHSRYLFPHRSDPNRVMSENTVLAVLWRCGYKGRMTGHGFRSVFSTACNEHQQPPDVVEAILAHAIADRTRAAYNRAMYLDARRQVLQWWADRVDVLTDEKSADVLSFPVSA